MRQIFDRLPIDGYQNNENVDWLTVFWDDLIDYLKSDICDDYFPKQLNPLDCEPIWLDYLAPLLGFSSKYWKTNWEVLTKRKILEKANWIHSNRGSRNVIEFFLDIFVPSSYIWISDYFRAGLTVLPGFIGNLSFQYFVIMPLNYGRLSNFWKEGKKIIEDYAPAYTEGILCYDQFYAGISAAGEPTFYGNSIV
jgi:hypothetical protein